MPRDHISKKTHCQRDASYKKQKDFNDSRFEYRWKLEGLTNTCVVEIRPTGDLDEVVETIPAIIVMYVAPRSRHSHPQSYDARGVQVGRNLAHAYLRVPDCEHVDLVFWNK